MDTPYKFTVCWLNSYAARSEGGAEDLGELFANWRLRGNEMRKFLASLSVFFVQLAWVAHGSSFTPLSRAAGSLLGLSEDRLFEVR